RTIAVTAAANVINFSAARRANEFQKCVDEVEAVNIIAHLFTFVSENAIRPALYCADHQIGKETVQLRTRVRWPSEAATAERNRRHSEIASVFLNQKIGGGLLCAANGVDTA